MKQKEQLYLTIHGHFYQPPRENPWTNEVPKEESASPFHDWNERIYQECYKPNTEAVIINEKGSVVNRVNNYEYMSFNFGPTLLDWIKSKHKHTFDKIIEADRKSVRLKNGHGNAIAQVYNHIIMPLANARDKETQVKWGMKYFRYHFGRESEGIWLSETAVNYDTIEVLINENIRYIILDPSQALKCRKIGDSAFLDVAYGNINPKVPYRCFSRKDSSRYIDIFFYDGPISKNIAFDDLIFSAERLLDRIDTAKIPGSSIPQLLSIAVDGETFGHHKKFSERTIAYLFSELASRRGYSVVNYAEFLDMQPPEWEVILKDGYNSEGSSWSCLHGVDRWKKDCGCNTGSQPGWNQKWREPLRDGLNSLRDKLSVIYEMLGREYFKDVWEARNDYIDLILDNSSDNINNFFVRHSKRELNSDEKELCLNMLEMQKYSMYMFTSCGWFFADISGLETKKILEYSKRAVEFGESLSGLDLKSGFLDELKKAHSNIPEFVNGKEIYLKLGE
jgi:alpha-amylase/alpha-mannosidase (GH57 family)